MRRAGSAAVAALTWACFSPAVWGGFLNWDDERMLVKNLMFRGFSLENVRWMFTTLHMGHYQPLAWLSFAADWAVWGMDARGFHLTNVLLHGVNAALVYWLAVWILERISAPAGDEVRLCVSAAVAALLFALHPLRVEPVAWVTERRELLSVMFVLLTVLAFLRAESFPRPSRQRRLGFLGAAGLHLGSLLCAPWGLVVPVALFLVSRLPGTVAPALRGGRRERRGAARNVTAHRASVVELAPFVALAIAAAPVAMAAAREVGATRPLGQHTLVDRAWQSAWGLAFYLRKTLLPTDLAPLYLLENKVDWQSASYLAAGAAVIAFTGVLWVLRKRWPWGLFTWGAFVLLVLPALGFFQSGPQRAADRYTYLASIPFSLLCAAAVRALFRVASGRRVVLAAAGGGIVACLVLLAAGSWRQIGYWRSSISLWEHAVRVEPANYVAQTNLGYAYQLVGNYEDAIRSFRAALDARPSELKPRHMLGLALARSEKYGEAIDEWKRLLAEHPGFTEAIFCLGLASFKIGRLEDAIRYYQQAITAEPNYVEAHRALGDAYAKQGRMELAAAEQAKASGISRPFRSPD